MNRQELVEEILRQIEDNTIENCRMWYDRKDYFPYSQRFTGAWVFFNHDGVVYDALGIAHCKDDKYDKAEGARIAQLRAAKIIACEIMHCHKDNLEDYVDDLLIIELTAEVNDAWSPSI